MKAILAKWWPTGVAIIVATAASLAFWYFDRVWLAHRDDLEGCRYWCLAHVKYDTPDKVVACIRKCKEAVDAP